MGTDLGSGMCLPFAYIQDWFWELKSGIWRGKSRSALCGQFPIVLKQWEFLQSSMQKFEIPHLVCRLQQSLGKLQWMGWCQHHSFAEQHYLPDIAQQNSLHRLLLQPWAAIKQFYLFARTGILDWSYPAALAGALPLSAHCSGQLQYQLVSLCSFLQRLHLLPDHKKTPSLLGMLDDIPS